MISVRMLEGSDAALYVGHHERNQLTSGVDGTPIFSAFSRRDGISDKVAYEQSCKQLWNEPIEGVGWERTWGAFVQESVTNQITIIGSVSLSTTRLIQTQSHRAILGMGIEPGFKRQGLGKKLMQAALEWAREQTHLKWVDLGVFVHNAPARRLYESFGFIETGRTIDCFRVDGHRLDDIQMSLDLR